MPGSRVLFDGVDVIQTTGLKHAIENRDTDGDFGLLSGKRPCPKLGANNPFVSTNRGLNQRSAAIASGLLPLQSSFRRDHVDTSVSL